MEKEKFFTNEGNPVPPHSWNSSNFGMEIQTNELNCTTSEQLSNCFINPNWDNSMDQSDPFESALSSIVSSPATSNAGGESIVLRELIGRLGSICNSGDISPQPYFNGNNSTNTSCYSTPLNSPPKLNLSMMRGKHFPSHPPISTDPGFVERAARFSCFGGNLSKVSSNQSMKVAGSPMGVQENKEEGISGSDKKFSKDFPPENPDSVEGSSVSEQSDHANARKRKSVPRGKGKEIPSSPSTKDVKVAVENEESNAKRSKSDGNEKESKENPKGPEPPKDYIHVRARRGQATDSHSLAERVRREKISERMKFLQDLVPGCNKVTGKAVMLDEIINYVQSLQRQVEFLSMKLSTVNPRMDLSMEALLSKDIFQSHGSVLHNNTYPVDTSAQGFLYGYQSQQGSNLHGDISHGTESPFSMNPSLNSALRRNPSMQLPPIDAFGEAVASQDLTFWEDDLQSVVQMGFAQNQAQSFHGTRATSQMKLEQ